MEGTAGSLLREARRRSRLSQSEVARRAKTAQSVISAYESGHRQPALSNARVFGSVARGEDDEGSDIDLLVDLAPGTSLIGLGALGRELPKVLGTPVDVVPADSIKPRAGLAVERDAIDL